MSSKKKKKGLLKSNTYQDFKQPCGSLKGSQLVPECACSHGYTGSEASQAKRETAVGVVQMFTYSIDYTKYGTLLPWAPNNLITTPSSLRQTPACAKLTNVLSSLNCMEAEKTANASARALKSGWVCSIPQHDHHHKLWFKVFRHSL